MELTDEELKALRAIWSHAEKVDWEVYDRLKARILSLTEVLNEQDDVLNTISGGER